MPRLQPSALSPVVMHGAVGRRQRRRVGQAPHISPKSASGTSSSALKTLALYIYRL